MSLRVLLMFAGALLWASIPAGALPILFSGTGTNTDIELPGGPGTQNLGLPSFTVLGNSAVVRAERTTCPNAGCVEEAELSQREDAGLGIWGGRENDEIDTDTLLFPYETLWFETIGGANWTLNSFELTLLFDDEFWRFDERALASIWLDGVIVDTITATGLGSGGAEGLWTYIGVTEFDAIQFNAPFDFGLSDFALRSLDVDYADQSTQITSVPEPNSLLLLAGGLAVAGIQRRRNRGRRAEQP